MKRKRISRREISTEEVDTEEEEDYKICAFLFRP